MPSGPYISQCEINLLLHRLTGNEQPETKAWNESEKMHGDVSKANFGMAIPHTHTWRNCRYYRLGDKEH